jgi:hypothetical protein
MQVVRRAIEKSNETIGAVFLKKVRNLELEQTFMRLLLVCSGEIYTLFLAYMGKLEGDFYHPIVIIGFIYILFSLAVILQVYFFPSGARWRHTVYMLLDVLLVCALLLLLGEYGVPFFAVYLWLTVVLDMAIRNLFFVLLFRYVGLLLLVNYLCSGKGSYFLQ